MFNHLNSDTIKNILEASCKISDEKAAKIDEILSGDLQKVYDNACPITSEVKDKLIEAMSDPQNLRIIVDENSDCYIEASEFANYCEATDQDLGSAVESIVEAYDKFVPGIRCDKIHIVFPQSKIGADKLGGKKLGIEVGTDSWAYKLIQGCQQFGIKANVGVTEKDVDKADDSTVSVEAN